MDTRQYIIDGSARMFMDMGVKAVRMDDIAAHLTVSKRTIYELFSDKRQIVAEALEYINARQKQEHLAMFAEQDNIIEEIIAMLRWWRAHASKISRFIQDVRRLYPDIFHEYIACNNAEGFDMLRRKIVRGVEQGMLLPEIDVETTLFVITRSIEMLAFGERSSLPENVTRQDVFRHIVLYFFRGVATKKGIRIIDEYINSNN
ncbi:MAG: TetR/AcrR family transcriptional regulator [Rikenellaceae bacterium]|jgi:AcrR family transcriptional regulator|nr:TetR/AcrR family transcriptional regulator [Rikenellaceae bacterium]